MSTEFEGSALGVSGRFKKVGTAPTILKPCEHYIIETGKWFKKKVVTIHGSPDGSTTHKVIEV